MWSGRRGDATAFQPRLDLGLFPSPRLRANTSAGWEALLTHQPREGRPVPDDAAGLEICEPEIIHGDVLTAVFDREQVRTSSATRRKELIRVLLRSFLLNPIRSRGTTFSPYGFGLCLGAGGNSAGFKDSL